MASKSNICVIFLLAILTVLLFFLFKSRDTYENSQRNILHGFIESISLTPPGDEQRFENGYTLNISGLAHKDIPLPTTIRLNQGINILGYFQLDTEYQFNATFALPGTKSTADLYLTLEPSQDSLNAPGLIIEELDINPIRIDIAETFRDLQTSPDLLWYPSRILELKKLDYRQVKEIVLLFSYQGDYRATQALLSHLFSSPTWGYWGILSDFFNMSKPQASSAIYARLLQPLPIEQRLPLLNLLNGTWNYSFVKQFLQHPDPRVRLYAAAKIGIMRKDDKLVDLPLMYLNKETNNLTLADVCWAIGKFENPEAHKKAYAVTLKLLSNPDPIVAKQAYHALSNLRQTDALHIVMDTLQKKSLLKNQPDIRDNLYATIGRLRKQELQPLLIELFEEEQSAYLKSIIIDFIGNPYSEDSKKKLHKLIHKDVPDYLRTVALKNMISNNLLSNEEIKRLYEQEESPLIRLQLQKEL